MVGFFSQLRTERVGDNYGLLMPPPAKHPSSPTFSPALPRVQPLQTLPLLHSLPTVTRPLTSRSTRGASSSAASVIRVVRNYGPLTLPPALLLLSQISRPLATAAPILLISQSTTGASSSRLMTASTAGRYGPTTPPRVKLLSSPTSARALTLPIQPSSKSMMDGSSSVPRSLPMGGSCGPMMPPQTRSHSLPTYFQAISTPILIHLQSTTGAFSSRLMTARADGSYGPTMPLRMRSLWLLRLSQVQKAEELACSPYMTTGSSSELMMEYMA